MELHRKVKKNKSNKSPKKSPLGKLKKRPISSKSKKTLISINQRDKSDEIKVRLLMDNDDIDPYGFSIEDKDRISEIDRALNLLQPDYNALSNIDTIRSDNDKDIDVLVQDIDIEESSKSETVLDISGDQNEDEIKQKSLLLGNAYLAEQRLIREQKNYEELLDKKLFKCKSRDIDYSRLFLDEFEDENDEYDLKSSKKSMGMTNSVSVKDIKHVIKNLSQINLNSSYITTSSVLLNQPNNEHQAELADVGNSSNGHINDSDIENINCSGNIADQHSQGSGNTNEQQSVDHIRRAPIDRQAIDRLLSEYRSEIVKLGFLRHSHRHPFPSSSTLNSLSSSLDTSPSSKMNTSRCNNTLQDIQKEKIQYDENNAYNEVSAFLQTRINQNFTTSPIKHFDPRTSSKSHNLKLKSNNMKKNIINESDTVFKLNSKSTFWSDNSENNIDIGYVRFPPIIPKTAIHNDTTDIERFLLPPPKSRRDHYQSLVQGVIGVGEEADTDGDINQEEELESNV